MEVVMNLIQELQNDILDSKTSLSSILRKAKVLASTLKNKEFKNWVDNELNGYPESKEKIPDYRQGRAESYGHFSGPFGSALKNFPIPSLNLPGQIKKHANELLLVQGVRVFESLIEIEGDSSDFHIPWPTDIVAIISDKVVQGYICISAWKSVSRGQVEQVLDTVRNRLLNFVLDLQERYPKISKSKDALLEVPEKQVASAVNTYIIGSHNVVTSGFGISQQVQQQIHSNDLDSLLRYMQEIGVQRDDAKELKKAIEEDGSRTEPGKFGSKVADWIGRMTKKILKGTWKVALSTTLTLITKALAYYYGWE